MSAAISLSSDPASDTQLIWSSISAVHEPVEVGFCAFQNENKHRAQTHLTKTYSPFIHQVLVASWTNILWPSAQGPRSTTLSPRPTALDPRSTTHRPRLTTHDRCPTRQTARGPRPTPHGPQPTARSPRPTAHGPQPAAPNQGDKLAYAFKHQNQT